MEASEAALLRQQQLLSPWSAVCACAAMALLYICFLYVPGFVLRLPPPPSFRHRLLRRFAGAISASVLSVLFSQRILSATAKKLEKSMDIISWLDAFGIRLHHLWQSVVFPISLTSLLYLGPLTARALEICEEWHQSTLGPNGSNCGSTLKELAWGFLHHLKILFGDILVWRNYILAPLTEEIVFRACMIPLLLCAGVQLVTIIFLCPLFFGLAHLNHFWELVHTHNFNTKRALVIVGVQVCYTTVFGWYTSFLYLRTGNILAPLSAHIFCNIMGLPDLHSVVQKAGGTFSCLVCGLTLLLLIGIASFFFMLMPLSEPSIYNYLSGECNDWLGYCRWK